MNSPRVAPSALGIALMLAVVALADPARAQSLVRDLSPSNPIGRSSNPQALVVAGGIGYFVATDQYGDELWRTDGSSGGTWRLKDLNPGVASSAPSALTAVGNLMFFAADVAGYGRELYVTDGTTAGTRLLRDIDLRPGLGSNPQHLLAYQGRVYFNADDGVSGPELWTSDGTTAGTTLVIDLYPGGNPANPGAPSDFAVWNGFLWFVGQDGRGREIYRTDGTAAGTQILVDFVPGPGSASPRQLCATAGELFFVATENSGGAELYATNGTALGTRRVFDIQPGQAGSNPGQLTALGALVVFDANDGTSGAEPWRSDGSAAGTFRLGDLSPGAATPLIQELTPASGSRVFFTGNGGTGRTLWRTDGTTAGTVLVSPSLIGVANLAAAFGGVACQAQTAGTGARLWTSDGTAAGTNPVIGSLPPSNIRALGNIVLHSAQDNLVGRELFWSDGSTSGLVLDLAVGYASSPLGLMTELRGNLFFAPTPPTGWVPWLSDGTANGTSELNLGLGNPSQPVRWRSEVWFVASTPTTSFELCYSNGTPAGTGVAFDLIPGTNTPAIQDLTPSAGRLFFTAQTGSGRELFATDGTLAGTLQFDLAPGGAGALPQDMTAFGNRCVFSANDGVLGREAWISDGTVGGTTLLGDLQPGFLGSSPGHFAVVGNRVFFAATLPGIGRELCVSDGTAAGTVLFADLLPGSLSSAPHDLVGCGNLLFFKALAPGAGIKLFVSDGTVSGTQVVRDITPSVANVPITEMVGTTGRLFFVADDQVHGKELWTSDGTFAGTVMVVDRMPGTGHGIMDGTLTHLPGSGSVVFVGADHVDGLQIWRSDGSLVGTERLGLFGSRPGSGASNLGKLTPAGGRIFCHASIDSSAGEELWVLPLQGGGQASAVAYGDSLCPGTLGLVPQIAAFGLPRLGNATFGIDLGQAPAASLAVLFVGPGATDLAAFGCRVLVQGPLTAGPALVANPFGFARTNLPIPATPGLLGASLFGQYLVLDANGPFLGTFTLSNGLAIQIGS